MVHTAIKQYNLTIANLNWEIPKNFKYGAHLKLDAGIFQI